MEEIIVLVMIMAVILERNIKFSSLLDMLFEILGSSPGMTAKGAVMTAKGAVMTAKGSVIPVFLNTVFVLNIKSL